MTSWLELNSHAGAGGPPGVGQSGDTLFSLPQKSRKDNPSTGEFTEMTFERDDETGQIRLRERRGRVIQSTEKIAKAAILRKKNWVKFGDVEDVPKNVCEEGVTTERKEEVRIKWLGTSRREQAAAKAAQRRARLKRQRMARIRAEKQRQVTQELGKDATGREVTHASKISTYGLSQSERARLNTGKSGGRGTSGDVYVPRAVREGWKDEEFYEIKISNVPEGMDRPDIKRLIDRFYEVHMHMRPPRNYRIRRKTSFRDDRTFFIVQFTSKTARDKAIEALDGKTYEFQILHVVESRPRGPRKN